MSDKKIKKSLKDIVREAVFCGEEGRRVVIVGGSDEDSSKLYEEIVGENSDILVVKVPRGGNYSRDEYGIELDKIEIDYDCR